MDDTGLQKLQKMENQTLPSHLDDLQNVATEVATSTSQENIG